MADENAPSTVSGDLPVRTASDEEPPDKLQAPEEGQRTEKKVTFDDNVDGDDKGQGLSAEVDLVEPKKKKKRKSRPKSKRGKVSLIKRFRILPVLQTVSHFL